MEPIGKLIRALRKEAGLTQEEFGRKIGVSKQSVSNYESDFRRPEYETLEAIADVLNKPIGFFISDDERIRELKRINGTVIDEQDHEIMMLAEKLTPENKRLAADFLSMLLNKQ